jgi:hypothetical protein
MDSVSPHEKKNKNNTFIGHYRFRSNWPSSGVQAVMVKDSAAHCNTVVFPAIVEASGYFGYVSFH